MFVPLYQITQHDTLEDSNLKIAGFVMIIHLTINQFLIQLH
jgi:hypothetical protein